MIKRLIEIVSPAGYCGKLTILIFHRVLSTPDSLFPKEMNVRHFDQICGWLKSWFNVLPLTEAISRLKEGGLPARSLSITFDDGYADNYEFAMPILKSHGMTGTFFIATGYLDGGRMWNDTIVESIKLTKEKTITLNEFEISSKINKSLTIESIEQKRTAIETIIHSIKYLPEDNREEIASNIAQQCHSTLPNNLMMTSQQLIEMRNAGMHIGAHTVTHPIIANLKSCEVRRQISESKNHLETLLQEEVKLFAYPNGKPNQDFRAEDAEIINELGFCAAFTTAWGVADSESDLMQLPRFTPWDRKKINFGARLFGNIVKNKKMRNDQIAK